MTGLRSPEVTAFFERVASEWDDMRVDYYDERVIDHLAELIALEPTMTVADVGTGTGFVAAGLAGHGSRVVGVDASPAMLDVAARNLARLGLSDVELMLGDVTALPLPDDSVDGAVANMVLHHAPEPLLMLAEMARIVRPGGGVAICDEFEHPYEWMRSEHADVWLGFTGEQVAELLEGVGLEEVGVEALGMQ